jgi:hypothetical protein
VHRLGCVWNIRDANPQGLIDQVAGFPGAELAVIRLRDESFGYRVSLGEASFESGSDLVGRKEVDPGGPKNPLA